MKKSPHNVLFSFLLNCRSNFLLCLLLFGQFLAVMGEKVSSPGADAAIGQDIQKLLLAMVVCCNSPVPHATTTDSYVPIHIFLNLSALLEK